MRSIKMNREWPNEYLFSLILLAGFMFLIGFLGYDRLDKHYRINISAVYSEFERRLDEERRMDLLVYDNTIQLRNFNTEVRRLLGYYKIIYSMENKERYGMDLDDYCFESSLARDNNPCKLNLF